MACPHALHAFSIQLVGVVSGGARINTNIIHSVQKHVFIAGSTIGVLCIALSAIRITRDTQILGSLIKPSLTGSDTSRVVRGKNVIF